MPAQHPKTKTARAPDTGPQFRSAAVARMALMPVATLRVWEQRYQAVRPATTATGHRRYSLADVQRTLLLRQLTQQGHAISALAPLQTEQLHALIAPPSAGARQAQPASPPSASALRLVVVGQALAQRLRLPAVLGQLPQPVEWVAVFDTLAHALDAVEGAPPAEVDALLYHAPGLPEQVPAELDAARRAWSARQLAVVYRFAGGAARQAFSDAGALLLRETVDDAALGAWAASLGGPPADTEDQTSPRGGPRRVRAAVPDPSVRPPPRRFDDATLTRLAALPSSSACECPRHVAELLLQIASFESYSADCANRHPGDAPLHAHLQQVSAIARQLFESAVDAVVSHEGISLS